MGRWGSEAADQTARDATRWNALARMTENSQFYAEPYEVPTA